MTEKMWYYWHRLPEIINKLDKLSSEKREKIRDKLKKDLMNEREKNIPLMLERLKNLKSLSFVLVKQSLMDKFKEALYNYLNGTDTSCIALCGIVGEEIVIDLFENKKIIIDGKELNINNKREALNNLKQEIKIKLLLDLEIIDSETYGKLDQIKIIRNKYIHPKNVSKSPKKDSLSSINLLIDIFHKVYKAKRIPLGVFLKSIGKLPKKK